jgi:serine/threonine-protein kinase HipA
LENGKRSVGLDKALAIAQQMSNSDAHGKNISFLVEPGGLRLAPTYDLVSVCVYPDIEHELAILILKG